MKEQSVRVKKLLLALKMSLKMSVHLDIEQACVVYFDQLLGAARTQKLVELLFFSHFQALVNIFPESHFHH